MSKLGKVILAMCGNTWTGHMCLTMTDIQSIVKECECTERQVRQYATELGIWILSMDGVG